MNAVNKRYISDATKFALQPSSLHGDTFEHSPKDVTTQGRGRRQMMANVLWALITDPQQN